MYSKYVQNLPDLKRLNVLKTVNIELFTHKTYKCY